MEKEIRELRRYTIPCSNWRSRGDSFEKHDLVLICHIDDVKRVLEKIESISKISEYDYLTNEGFAVWSWTITPSKKGERKEELRLFQVYGKTRNEEIELKIDEAVGLLIPEEVLRHQRFLFTFVREKPPIQYVITVLIQNVFPIFQQKSERDTYRIEVDLIYDRAKNLFPSWLEYDQETIQMKRRWIREGLEKLAELRMIFKIPDEKDLWEIPIPTIRPRRPMQEAICDKLAKIRLRELRKRRVPSISRRKKKPRSSPKDRRLTEFLR